MNRFWHWFKKVPVLAIATASNMISPAHAELLVSPETITPAGIRSNTVSTTLTLSNNPSNTVVKAAASDLSRADSAATIPSAKIGIEPNEVQVPDNALSQVTITINLAEVSANGEFTGSIYLYSHAPVTANLCRRP